MRGALFETMVMAELMKSRLNRGERPQLYFWRDSNGNEVDVLAEQGEGVRPIEIKSGKTLASDAFTGLEKWRKLAGENALAPALIYGGTDNYRQNGVEVCAWAQCGQVLGM